MLITLSQLLRRRRRRILVGAAVLAVSLAVIAAHSATTGGDHHMGEDLAMCLAIAESALTAVGIALARPSISGLSVPFAQPCGLIGHPRGPHVTPRARAGPPALQVFRL